MGRTISWAAMDDPRPPAANRTPVAGPVLGAVGLRRDGRERDRRHVRLLRLPDPHRSATTCRGDHRRRVGCSGRWRSPAWWSRCWPQSPGSGSTRRGGVARVLAMPHRAGGAADVGDEPDPRRLPLLVARPGAARDAPPRAASLRPCRTTPCCVSSPRRRHRAGSPDSVGAWAISAASCCCSSSMSVFISGDGDTRGLLDLPAADGQNVRAAMLMTAAWFVVVRAAGVHRRAASDSHRPRTGDKPIGFFGAYRQLWSEIVGEWRRDRNVVYYLLASAVFRDGLTGVFAFGAVLGRQRVRHLGRRRAAVRGQRQRDRRHRCVPRRSARRPTRIQARHRRLAYVDDRRRGRADDAVGTARVLGLRAAAVPVRSGRRSRRRAR